MPAPMPAPTSIVDTILRLLNEHGDAAYFGEPVSQREHALQTAWLAEQESAPPALVVAALLHDVGHLLHGLPESVADGGVDAKHEEAGHAWLARHFGPDVTEPVRMHVDAKRYLCATDANYLAGLSLASVQSLALQGGPFTRADAMAFADLPFAQSAVRLRRWDDSAKTPGLDVPDAEHYRARLTALVCFDLDIAHAWLTD
jgi:phosphonate degradation associated HDIG domain protein